MTFRQKRQHGLLGRSAPVLTLFAVGCSLIVPLDEYVGTGTRGGGTSSGGSGASAGSGGTNVVGGTESALGGTGGGTGGSIQVGGTRNGAMAGTGVSGGGTGESGGSNGGTSYGGAPEDGGMGGEPAGGDGPITTLGGSAGTGTGEMGGLGGSAGGGGGGMGGITAAGCGGKPNFMTDPLNCGSCGHRCDPAEQECLAGYCASSPCDGICAVYKTVTLKAGDGYRQDGIGTGEVCTEIYGYAPRSGTPSLVCWNFASGRTLQVNGKGIPCDFTGHPFDVPLRREGLCVRVTAGNQSTAGFELPD